MDIGSVGIRWLSCIRDDGVAFAESNVPGDKLRAGWAALKRKIKFRACFLQKRGDWSWLKQALAFVDWKGEGPLERCCYKCLANHGSLPFTDPTSNALWRLHELTHKMYIQLAYLQNTYISSLFDVLGFKPEFCSIDLMHCGDLGINLYLLASTLFELFIEMGGLVTKPQEKLGELMELIKSGAKALKMGRSPINKLTMQMVKEPSKSPKLKVKAAESRHLLPIVRHILERYFPQDTEHKRLRYDCIVALDDMYKEMRKPVGVFQGPTASMLGRRHLILYRELVKEAIESRGHQ